MDKEKERNISHLLHTIRTADSIKPQPQQSYREPADDEPDIPMATCSQVTYPQTPGQPVADSLNRHTSDEEGAPSTWHVSLAEHEAVDLSCDLISFGSETTCGHDDSSESHTSEDVVVLDSWEELTAADGKTVIGHHSGDNPSAIDDASCSENRQITEEPLLNTVCNQEVKPVLRDYLVQTFC